MRVVDNGKEMELYFFSMQNGLVSFFFKYIHLFYCANIKTIEKLNINKLHTQSAPINNLQYKIL